jgi:pimeloyl-ACP methyl ester carboxylesterase
MRSSPQIVTLADGQQVGLAEYGDPAGTPLLALHGAPASRLMFAPADEAARRYGLRLICPDRPGYGSSPPDVAPTLVSRAGDLAAVADHLHLERFAILAISGGGPYAVALAALVGRRCLAVALVSPIGPVAEVIAVEKTPGSLVPAGFRRFFIDLQGWPRLVAVGSRAAAAAFRLAPGAMVRLAALSLSVADRRILGSRKARRDITVMTLEALRSGIRGGLDDLALYSRPWGVAYDRVTSPTLIWQGTEDRIVPPGATYFLASRIAGARLERIEGAGHFWILDHVEDVLATLARAIEPG